jgi:hypothetical protein
MGNEQSIFIRRVKIKVVCRTWGFYHTIDPEVSGGDPKLFKGKLFKKGQVRMLGKDYQEALHRAQGRLRNAPATFGNKKQGSTDGVFSIRQRALPLFEEFMVPHFAKYFHEVDIFVAQYPTARNQWLKAMLRPHLEEVAKKKGFNQDWIDAVYSDIRQAYPAPASIRKRFHAKLVPVGDMAIYPTDEGSEFIDVLDKKGAEIRQRMINFAMLDEMAAEEAERVGWFRQLANYGRKLEEQAENEKFIGQTINSMRLFLERHGAMASIKDMKIVKLMGDLRDLLPEEDYSTMRNNGVSEKILNKLARIKKLSKVGFNEAKVKAATYAKKARQVEIF